MAVTTHLNEIKKKYFNALDKQYDEDMLTSRIIKKIDKVTKVQKQLSDIVDQLSIHIDAYETVSVEGGDADMMIQKQIISATQLIDKVD